MRPHPSSAHSPKAVIDELARATGRSFEDAREAYERELVRLEADAKVRTYLPVIARKRAREALLRH